MIPKFSVNEIVIVQSPHYPETNGEYEVVQVLTYLEFRAHCQNQFKADPEGFIYKLKDYCATGKVNPENKTDCVSEPSLRKKHLPGEFSFSSLMDNLKLPQKQEN